MSLILFQRFAKLSLVRAAFWLVMGASLLIMPELDFLLNGMFYVLTGYFLVNAVLRIFFFVRETATENNQNNRANSVCRYISLAIAILYIIAAIHFIVYREWLNEFTPAFLGGLLMLEGILYFVMALCSNTALQKFLLVTLSIAIFLGAVVTIGFTFGFGIGGIHGITVVLGIALLLAFLYEIVAFYVYRRNKASCFEKEGA